MKYRKTLPVRNEMTVRIVSRTVPSSKRVDTRSRRIRRRAMIRYDHASAPIRAPRNPAMRSTQ